MASMNGNNYYNRKATELSANVKSLKTKITNIQKNTNRNITNLETNVNSVVEGVKELKNEVSGVQERFATEAKAILNTINSNNISNEENKTKLKNYTNTILRKINTNINKKTTTIRKMDGIIRDLKRLSGNAKAKATNNAAKAKAAKNSEAQKAVQRAAKNAEVNSIKTQLNKLLEELNTVTTKIGPVNNFRNNGKGPLFPARNTEKNK